MARKTDSKPRCLGAVYKDSEHYYLAVSGHQLATFKSGKLLVSKSKRVLAQVDISLGALLTLWGADPDEFDRLVTDTFFDPSRCGLTIRDRDSISKPADVMLDFELRRRASFHPPGKNAI